MTTTSETSLEMTRATSTSSVFRTAREPRSMGALAAGVTLVAGLCGGSASHPPAPKAAVVVEAGAAPSPSATAAGRQPLPQSVFIKVPYTSQAPRADWPTHEDYLAPA